MLSSDFLSRAGLIDLSRVASAKVIVPEFVAAEINSQTTFAKGNCRMKGLRIYDPISPNTILG